MSQSKQKNKKKRRRRSYPKKRLGTFYLIGQLFVILGAILIIVAAILDLIGGVGQPDVWQSYTFGQFNIPILPSIIAIVMAVLILWFIIDRQFAYRLNLIILAIILILLALIAGNVGALAVIIGAIFIIFEQLSRS